MNKVLWNNEMDLVVGLRTEVDRGKFEDIAQSTHKELTGETIYLKEWILSETDLLLKLELL